MLRSERAVMVNIAIMRTFVRLRQILATHKDLAEKLAAKVVFEVLRQLMEPPPEAPQHPIGFVGGRRGLHRRTAGVTGAWLRSAR